VVRRLDDAALTADPMIAALDPELDSVVNVNEPADYAAARGRPAPEVTVRLFGALAKDKAARGHAVMRKGTASWPDRPGPLTVHAATIDEAADAVGLLFDRHVTAALNGDQITRDGLTPLAAGDTVFFMSADAGG
jgi:molybdopterin-guanine dinucleotide biosynthesis protein A